MTALHHAVTGYRPDVIDVLLEAGADAEAVDIYGRDPLDYARLKWSRHERLAPALERLEALFAEVP